MSAPQRCCWLLGARKFSNEHYICPDCGHHAWAIYQRPIEGTGNWVYINPNTKEIEVSSYEKDIFGAEHFTMRTIEILKDERLGHREPKAYFDGKWENSVGSCGNFNCHAQFFDSNRQVIHRIDDRDIYYIFNNPIPERLRRQNL